jgi:hypothetical protein
MSWGNELGTRGTAEELAITIPPNTEWVVATPPKTEVGRETAASMEGATVTVGIAAMPPPLARMTAAAAVTEELGKLANEGTSGVWNRAENNMTFSSSKYGRKRRNTEGSHRDGGD